MLHKSVTDTYNFLGHFYQVAAYAFILLASIPSSAKQAIGRRSWFTSMRSQLILTFTLVALIGVGLIGGYGYLVSQDYIHDGIEASYSMHTELSNAAIQDTLREIQSDLSVAADASAMEELIRARDSGGIDSLSGMSYASAATHVESLFVDIAQTSQRYSQLRYLDEDGNEIVRVNYNGTQTQNTVASELQNQANQLYFRGAMQVPAGQIYVSHLQLYREHGQIQVPYLPTALYAMPVFNERGERRGVVIFNVITEKVFHQSAVYWPNEKGTFLFIADSTGYYAHNSAYPEKEWGGPADLNTGQGVRTDFPEIADDILSGQAGKAYTNDLEVFYSPIRVGPGVSDYWILGLVIPRSMIEAPAHQFTWAFIGVLALSLLLATVAGSLATHRIAHPLETLRDGALQIASGNLQHEVQVSTSGEVADLAGAFNQMTKELQHSFAETQQRLRELEVLFDISSALRVSASVDEMYPIILDKTVTWLGASAGAIIMLNTDNAGRAGQTLQVVRDTSGEISQLTHLLEEMPTECVMRTGGYCFGRPDCPIYPYNGGPLKISCGALKVGDEILGGLYLGIETQAPFSQSDLRIQRAIADMAGNAIRRTRLFDDIKLYRDVYYSGGDAVVISDMQSRIVDVNSAFEKITGFSRDEALGQKPSIIKSQHTTLEFYQAMWAKILSEGSWNGEIINRRKSGEEWDSLLTISAVKDERGNVIGYVGINKDITYLKGLERELRAYAALLEETYLNTLYTLTAALDLRDKETEGHSQRVADMTMKLARAIGVNEEELVHVHRGALLHDIGKMGIPDSILLKPGKLTAEEWTIMRKHPQYAYDMLSSIAYLHPALDIPYCHHEKWNGTGYPRGLKGEQIPLTARLFAIVDVWDALRSDRPYRQKWPEKKVIEYIKDGSGAHFDPKVVEVFLHLVDEKTDEHQDTE